jgi:hypothetical protein
MVLSLVLAACGNTTGIWLARVPYAEDIASCESTFDENFKDGYRPTGGGGGGNGEWEVTEEYTGTDFVFFFEITLTEDGGGALVNDGQVYPGIYEGDTWTFSWEDLDQSQETAEHDEGYSYAHVYNHTVTTTIEFTPTGIGNGGGTWSSVDAVDEGYYADDEWDPRDYAGGAYDIPVSDEGSDWYLVREDEDEDGETIIVPQVNDPEEDDCDSNTCEVRSSTSCASEFEFTATRTNKDDTDSFDYLDGTTNGSPAGGGGG